MSNFPSHSLPNFDAESKDDALFHYTTATGLIGIFDAKAVWSTAYYCANDEQELSTGKGVLTGMFREEMYRLRKAKDERIEKFYRRGVDPFEYAEQFEGLISSLFFSSFCAYITCFCKSTSEEDFHHGLLSQWRGYGPDGGYAVQISRAKLKAAIAADSSQQYDLKDVSYAVQNDLRQKVLTHKEAFLGAFERHLDLLAEPIDSSKREWPNPVPTLLGGPLEDLLGYLVHTKNQHFAEERECRLSLIQNMSHLSDAPKARYFNRNGLLVPYISTSSSKFDILDCVEWILVGPGPRLNARLKSVTQLVNQDGRDIKVRVSHIPYTRL
jgi:Protein of unknown function (DUF2971)